MKFTKPLAIEMVFLYNFCPYLHVVQIGYLEFLILVFWLDYLFKIQFEFSEEWNHDDDFRSSLSFVRPSVCSSRPFVRSSVGKFSVYSDLPETFPKLCPRTKDRMAI